MTEPSGSGAGRHREATIALGGNRDAILALAWSPDGSLLASGGGDGTVRLFEPLRADGEIGLQGHDEAVETASWSPDGRLLASGAEDGTVRLWTSDGRESVGLLERRGLGHQPGLVIGWVSPRHRQSEPPSGSHLEPALARAAPSPPRQCSLGVFRCVGPYGGPSRVRYRSRLARRLRASRGEAAGAVATRWRQLGALLVAGREAARWLDERVAERWWRAGCDTARIRRHGEGHCLVPERGEAGCRRGRWVDMALEADHNRASVGAARTLGPGLATGIHPRPRGECVGMVSRWRSVGLRGP